MMIQLMPQVRRHIDALKIASRSAIAVPRGCAGRYWRGRYAGFRPAIVGVGVDRSTIIDATARRWRPPPAGRACACDAGVMAVTARRVVADAIQTGGKREYRWIGTCFPSWPTGGNVPGFGDIARLFAGPERREPS